MSQEVLHRPLNVAVLTVSDTRTMELIRAETRFKNY